MTQNASAALFSIWMVVLSASTPTSAQTTSCESLATLDIPDTVITSVATVLAAGGLPSYCRVRGTVHAVPDSNVGFEVRMPPNWNGKLFFQGGQGFAGRIPNPSLGLQRGYATVGTDTGHVSPTILEASWALNNRTAEIDFGYRAIHVSLVSSRAIIDAYYGAPPALAYFNGCSNGGRHGLMEAQRYPDDFNGIIAGAPVLDHTGLVVGFDWDMQALLLTPGSNIPVSKLPVIGNAVVAACDGVDGLVDGLIDDPRRCDFNPTVLLCPNGDAPDCLTAPQVASLQKIYAGPTNSDGKQLFPGFAMGGETPDNSNTGWDAYITGNAITNPPLQLTLLDQFVKYLAFELDDPNFDWRTFDFNADPKRMQFMASILNATDTDLSPFASAGGKLLIYQGWSDIAQSPLRTIEYYKVSQRGIGRKQSEEFARLFMAPGMFHCMGGPGPNRLDALTALENWVERGEAPDSIIASHSNALGVVDRTRPLCPYPQVARYVGSGSIDDASNFSCLGPPPSPEK